MPTITHSSAVFSPCRTYRYQLWRKWGGSNYAMFIGLNPSTADETLDDPTIRRCIRFAQDWGYGALCMTNIFAFRATDPKVMRAHPSPIGTDNDGHLLRLASEAGVVIAAWGVHGDHMSRGQAVRHMLWSDNMCHLGLTKDGHPKHPLYLKADLKPVKWQ